MKAENQFSRSLGAFTGVIVGAWSGTLGFPLFISIILGTVAGTLCFLVLET